jgi:hypothetical protein
MLQPPLDVKAASRLAESVQLKGLSFIDIEGKYVAVIDPTPGASLTWDTPDPTVVWHVDGRELRAVVPMRLGIDVEDDDTSNGQAKTRLAEFLVVMRLDYELKDGAEWSMDEVPHYAGISGFLHAWPYFRAEIQSLTGKLGLPPLLLPVVVSGHVAQRVSVVEQKEIKPPALPPGPAPKKAKKQASTGRKGR